MLCLPISKKIFTAWSKHDIASAEHPITQKFRLIFKTVIMDLKSELSYVNMYNATYYIKVRVSLKLEQNCIWQKC